MTTLSGILFLLAAVCIVLAIGRTTFRSTGPQWDPTWMEYKKTYEKRQKEGWK